MNSTFFAIIFAAIFAMVNGAPEPETRYVKSPIVLSNSDWTPLTVIDHTMDLALPEYRAPRKVMLDKSFNDFDFQDELYAPTPKPIQKRHQIPAKIQIPIPVVRAKKESGYKPSAKQVKIISHNKNVSQKGDKKYHFE